jgi:HlyD family secretion protein
VDRANATERQSQAALRAARFNVEVARHTLAAARAALRVYSETDPSTQAREWVGVHAPVAGQVLAVRRESEGPVSMGEPLLELGDPAFLEIVADVLSTDAVRIRPGQLVRIERWGGPTLSGRVRRVEPAGFTKISALGVEEQRVWVIVDLTSPRAEWRTLGDQYRVEATFVLWAGDRVLQVPDSALFRHQGGWAVFRLREGRARLTAVTTGHRAGLRVQILEGLSPGDEVITHPDDRIRDGMRVERSGT